MTPQAQLLKLTLPPDRYACNMTVAMCLEKIIGPLPSTLLNIGNSLDQIELFLPVEQNITHLRKIEKKIPFEAESFDVVLAIDVLDRIAPADRPEILAELCRVSKKNLILAAPFHKNYLENAENIVRQQYQENTGTPHPVLSDHQKFGLPNQQQVETFLQSTNYHFFTFGQGNMTGWVLEQLWNGARAGESESEKLTAFAEYANQHFAELGHYREPTYRTFFCISKQDELPADTIRKIIASHNGGFSMKTFSWLLKTAFTESRKMLNRRKKQLNLLADRIIHGQEKIKTLTSQVENFAQLQTQLQTQFQEETKMLTTKLQEQSIRTMELEKNLENNDQKNSIDQLNAELQAMEQQTKTIKKYALHQDELLEKKNHLLKTKDAMLEALREDIARQKSFTANIKSSFWWKCVSFFGLQTKEPKASKNQLSHKENAAAPPTRKTQPDQESFPYKPVISVLISVCNIPKHLLQKAVQSVRDQTYTRWELCLCDDAAHDTSIKLFLEKLQQADGRIKVVSHQKEYGIVKTANDALALATGGYVGWLEGKDELAPDALLKIVKTLQEKKYDGLYSDEDSIDEQGHCHKRSLKPDWSPDLLLSTNYIGHFAVYRRKILHELGGLREKFAGAQEYDLRLRVADKTENIKHIPKILYHKRISEKVKEEESTETLSASIKALQDTLKRRQIAGEVLEGTRTGTFRIRRILKDTPKISIVVPVKDDKTYLERCIQSLKTTTYQNYEIILLDNESERFETMEYLQQVSANPNIKCYSDRAAFFKALENEEIGEMFVFLRNRIEIATPDWLEHLLEHAQRPEVGAVNAKEIIANPFTNYDQIPLTPSDLIRNDTMVDTNCFMMRRDVFKKIRQKKENKEEFPLENISPEFQKMNMNIVFTPYALYIL